MSTSNIQSDSGQISNIIKTSKQIRQRVDDRHWQLFETRLKNSLTDINKENYTKSNDYRIIDRLKQIDQPQQPIEPYQRWQIFCSQLTNESNETDRLLSIYHNIWIKNWNTIETYDTHKRNNKINLISTENNFLKKILSTEHDKKVISSILHQNI